jgi:hypothetical protein
MEPSIQHIYLDGIHLVCLFGGVAVGIGIGYLFGWLHFSDAEKGAAE